MNRPVIHVDMDGVLAKWNEEASEEDIHMLGYFYNLELERSIRDTVLILASAGYDVEILTAAFKEAIQDKIGWLEKVGLGHLKVVIVPYGEKKTDYIEPGRKHILIDDYSKNLQEWEQQGNIAIKFFNGINNRPKIKVVGDTLKVQMDSWTGYSIDYRMKPEQMATIVSAVAQTA